MDRAEVERAAHQAAGEWQQQIQQDEALRTRLITQGPLRTVDSVVALAVEEFRVSGKRIGLPEAGEFENLFRRRLTHLLSPSVDTSGGVKPTSPQANVASGGYVSGERFRNESSTAERVISLLKAFAWLSVLGGVILAIVEFTNVHQTLPGYGTYTNDAAITAGIVFLVVGVFYAVMFYAFAFVIELLAEIASNTSKSSRR